MSLDLIILGELKRKSQHIGEMRRNLKNKNIHKVIHFNLGTLYKQIKKLQEKEYVIGEKRKQRGKEIIVYSVTLKGVEFFQKILEDRVKLYETNIFIDINELIVNFEFINKKDQLRYFDYIKDGLEKKTQKFFENENFVSYTDKMIFRQQIRVINALKEWIMEEKNGILLDQN